MELSPHALWPEGPWAKTLEERIEKTMKKDYVSVILQDPNYKGIFKCKRCKSHKRHTMKCKLEVRMNL